MTSMKVQVVGFDVLKELYEVDVEVRAKEIKKLHEEVRLKIEKKNAKYVEQANRRRKYVEFEVGELV